MITKIFQPSGLYIPICTPMRQWRFDKESYAQLIHSVIDHVDGFVPCLSSGEWQKMDKNLRKEVLETTCSLTQKPVFVWIKRKTIKEVIELLEVAETVGATWAAIPVKGETQQEIQSYVETIATQTKLPLIIYNTETQHINDINILSQIDVLENVVAIKDSSMNPEFFDQMVQRRKQNALHMHVFQWMEHELHTSKEADWFLISLANVEPALCKEYLQTWKQELEAKIIELFWKYNLWAERYISLKAILMTKGIISSAEEINPFITP